jgi:AcrR family transcriptional regulator
MSSYTVRRKYARCVITPIEPVGNPRAADNDGDPTRVLRLLWRDRLGDPRGSRGPRTKLTVDEVVAAATALADEEGLDAFSMRRVADRLGIGVMTLYTYVPDRGALLGLVRDAVAGESTLAPHRGDLRERLDAVARDLWTEYQRHPWLVDLQIGRPWLGPNESHRYEWQLAALNGAGLDDLAMDGVVTAITAYVGGAATARVVTQRSRASSTLTDLEWWELNAPVLEQVITPGDFPISGRVGQAVGEAYGLGDPDVAFEFGLGLLLDGVEALIARTTG